VVSASTGLALLHIKNDPERALAAFRDGLQSDPNNIAIYMGIDQALSLLNRPPQERVEALEKYPLMDAAPSGLIFELILNLAEAGNFERATQLFHNRFFAREEGGTNVRQVWVELQLQQALSHSRGGRCGDALTAADHIGKEVAGLDFTRDGLDPIVGSARSSYLLSKVYQTCGKSIEGKQKLQLAASASAVDQVLWAYRAAQELPNFDQAKWQDRLREARDQAASRSETSSYPSWWMYTTGLLADQLKDSAEAELRFRKALLLPDRMLAYHFTRLARAER
jgi:tetratricopeptide (TPR) repeat protein